MVFGATPRDIARVPNASIRKLLIKNLATEDPRLFSRFAEALRQSDGENHLLRNSGLYPLCGRGDINLYAVFAELMRNHLSLAGRLGCVLPGGIATDDTTKTLFTDLVQSNSLLTSPDGMQSQPRRVVLDY